MDKEFEQAMNEIFEEQEKYKFNRDRLWTLNHHYFKEKFHIADLWFRQLKEECEDCVGFYGFKDKPYGNYQEDILEYAYDKKMGIYIDQTTMGMCCDCYQGIISIPMKNGKYFCLWYQVI